LFPVFGVFTIFAFLGHSLLLDAAYVDCRALPVSSKIFSGLTCFRLRFELRKYYQSTVVQFIHFISAFVCFAQAVKAYEKRFLPLGLSFAA
jgi:hypothetical protein